MAGPPDRLLQVRLRPDGSLNVRADGRLDPSDYRLFVPEFERLVCGGGRRKMLTELGPRFAGWTLLGLFEDLRFDLRFRRYFGPTAIVGHRLWQRVGTALLKPFYRAQMRYFDASERAEAERWLRSSSCVSPAGQARRLCSMKRLRLSTRMSVELPTFTNSICPQPISS